MADRTIGGLQEAPIGALPGIADLYDDSLLPVEQQGEARKMTGAQWKRYAQAGVSGYVEGAKEAAKAAADSAAAAEKSAENAAGSAGEAAGSAQSAKEYSGKPPVIRDGTWWTWNAERKEYVDTGEAARGERGEIGPPGIQGIPGDQGIQGETGAGIQSIERTGGDGSPGTVDTYTITMTDGSNATFSVYNGADGTSFTVLGRYGTLDELIEAHPVGSKSDAWAVGSAEDNDVYLWDVDAQTWRNIGSLQGPPGPAGADGAPGRDGADGKSAYQIAVDGGFSGDEEEWLASLKGEDGAQGADGTQGPAGADGKSAYQIAVDGGFSGDEEEWLASLKGEDGAQGADGTQGPAGADGKTAYQYAVDGGYTGTEEEFRALMGSGPWLPLEGGVMKGKISGIVTPIEGADAANKAYVDNKLINPVFRGYFSHNRVNGSPIGNNSIAIGAGIVASGHSSFAEGESTKASGRWSHAAGLFTEATADFSYSGGRYTKAAAAIQTAIGDYNVVYAGQSEYSRNESAIFIVGKGDSESYRANALRVSTTGVYASGSYNAFGADYAELFEWADGNPDKEDRAGRFVTLDGEKIRLAGPGEDYVLGIISGSPSVIGDVHDDQWAGMYLYDIFGRPLWEDVEVPAVTMEMPGPEDPERTVPQVVIPAHTERRQKLNPDYDSEMTYLPRTQRPEWDAVGLLGKLVAVDDGSCQVNSWCTAGEGGVAVHSEARTRFRVMARLDENHVRLMVLQTA